MEVAGRDIGLPARARRDAVLTTVRAYREAMRRFAGMGNLEVWYARLDAAAIAPEIERRHGQKRGGISGAASSARSPRTTCARSRS